MRGEGRGRGRRRRSPDRESGRDGRDNGDGRRGREDGYSREGRGGRDARGGRDSRSGRDGKDGRDARSARDNRSGRDNKGGRDGRSARDSRGGRDSKFSPEKRSGPRLKWTAPKISKEPLPVFDCPCCGKPVKELGSAITDKTSGSVAHFDCVMAKITECEHLGTGDFIAYIGGGRFGVVYYPNPHDKKKIHIRKIIEWEDQNKRAEWRKDVADRYSLT